MESPSLRLTHPQQSGAGGQLGPTITHNEKATPFGAILQAQADDEERRLANSV